MSKIETKQKTFLVKPYTTSELAAFYKVCSRTLRKWLKSIENEVGERIGRYYTVNQVKIIIEKLGIPKDIEI
jgi:hypothetical protein